MKRLYILRHADAEYVAESDAARALTPTGIAQCEVVARFCVRKGIQPSLILTSPFRRTRETARIVATGLEPTEIIEAAFLRSGMDPFTGMERLAEYTRFDDLMIVGHQPDLGELAAVLLGFPHALDLHKASLTLLHLRQFAPGAATLGFSTPVKLMLE